MRKSTKRLLIIVALIILTIIVNRILWLNSHYVVPILTYHHVGHNSDKLKDLNTVSVESFEKQMAFLKRYGYKVISFEELVEGLNKGERFSHNTVVIHFDD